VVLVQKLFGKKLTGGFQKIFIMAVFIGALRGDELLQLTV
jgi:hypothetical protein